MEPASSTSEEETFVWTVHLARENPAKLVVCVAATVLTSAAAFYAVGPVAAIAVAAVMIASVGEFVFPVTYRITTRGAECRMLLKTSTIRWPNVKRCYIDDLGIKLSPLDRRSRIEAFRGVYLRFSDNRTQVTDVVKRMRESRCTE